MSFFTALSGLKAAQTDISSTSNNIANVATLGYHGSRVEFADIYTSSPQANPRTSVGSGVQISRISRSFAQGSMTSTQNTLDMAIQGAGFFRVETGKEGGDAVYTRAGAFGMDNEGFVVNSKGQYLTGYATAADGTALNLGTASPLQVPLKQGTAKATASLSFGASFPVGAMGQAAQSAVPPLAFDPSDAQSYAFASPLNMLDPQGQPMDAVGYFALADTPDVTDPATRYQFHLVINGLEVAPDAAAASETLLEFDADGFLIGGGNPRFTFEGRPLAFDMARSRLDASQTAMQVSTMTGDGEVARKLSMMELDGDGVLWASYGGADAVAVGMVAVANFANTSGLRSLGDASYAATSTSGAPELGRPGLDGLGAVRGGALEQANVDLTEELVNLVVAQRNYQASAKALETNQALSQTIMNMRS